MTLETIRKLYQARPFLPFVLHLADGRQIPVLHHEFVAAPPSGRTLVVVQPDESVNIIDLLLVTDIEMKPGAQIAQQNGG